MSVRCVSCLLSSCHRADISVALTSTKAYHKRHINKQRRLRVRLYHYSLMPTESWFNASHIFLPSAEAYQCRLITIQTSVLFRRMGESAASHLVRFPNPFCVHFWMLSRKMMVLWHIWEALSYESISHSAPNAASTQSYCSFSEAPRHKRQEGRRQTVSGKKNKKDRQR